MASILLNSIIYASSQSEFVLEFVEVFFEFIAIILHFSSFILTDFASQAILKMLYFRYFRSLIFPSL